MAASPAPQDGPVPTSTVVGYPAFDDETGHYNISVSWSIPDGQADTYGFVLDRQTGSDVKTRQTLQIFEPYPEGVDYVTNGGDYLDENVTDNQTYTYFVKTVDRVGNESAFAQAVSKAAYDDTQVPTGPKLAAIQISQTLPTKITISINYPDHSEKLQLDRLYVSLDNHPVDWWSIDNLDAKQVPFVVTYQDLAKNSDREKYTEAGSLDNGKTFGAIPSPDGLPNHQFAALELAPVGTQGGQPVWPPILSLSGLAYGSHTVSLSNGDGTNLFRASIKVNLTKELPSQNLILDMKAATK